MVNFSSSDAELFLLSLRSKMVKQTNTKSIAFGETKPISIDYYWNIT